MNIVAKICGADVELGNFAAAGARGTPGAVAGALLAAIDGIPHRAPSGFCARRPSELDTDRGRKFLRNGGCAYIDLDHLEICLPEVRSARDHVAAWHAMLRVARSAQQAVNGHLRAGRVEVLVNSSDGQGSSYGSHLNMLVSRRAWDDIFSRKLHPLLFLAAHQASSVVVTGQGKVGGENGAGAVPFQLSQRADFIETLVGPQTTFRRPLVNSRDEPLCGPHGEAADLARLHVICYESNLAQTAHLLKVGALQVVLALIEADHTNTALVLDDPVGALRRWSRDPSLTHRERLANGGLVTAIELQRRFVEEARAIVDGGALEVYVPDAESILRLWDDTLTRLETGDFETLARRLDWVLKLSMLRSVAEQRGLTWESAEMKHLDHLYSSLDPDDGLFWSYERAGLVDRIVPDADIEYFVTEPPRDTRAWTRAMLLRGDASAIRDVDWKYVGFKGGGGSAAWRVNLQDPRNHGQTVWDAE